MEDFRGQSCHTARWPHEGVDFAGKRVAVIGTGSTGVQTIQEVAKTAAQLTVFQRTPNWCVPLHNAPITDAEQPAIKANYPEMFRRCQETFACFLHTPTRARPSRSRRRSGGVLGAALQQSGFRAVAGDFSDIQTNRAANEELSAFVAKKIRQRVKDPKVAEMLIPKDHGFGTRRVPLETKYYEVYNQPNVELVDIKATPIERITETGLRTSERDRIRHHRLRHRLRRHHRQLRPHRHPRRGGAPAEGGVGAWPADLHGGDGGGLPQHADADGAAYRARQHPAQHRVQRGLGDRADRPHAGQGAERGGCAAGGGGGLDRACEGGGRRAALERDQLLVHRREQQRRGQADPHHRPLQRQRPGLSRLVRRGGGEGVSGSRAGLRPATALRGGGPTIVVPARPDDHSGLRSHPNANPPQPSG
ncbi:hypothetical protein ACFQU2_10265 [Siccirubricoccus deserti]